MKYAVSNEGKSPPTKKKTPSGALGLDPSGSFEAAAAGSSVSLLFCFYQTCTAVGSALFCFFFFCKTVIEII